MSLNSLRPEEARDFAIMSFIRDVERLVIDNGGTIYGGYVRDLVCGAAPSDLSDIDCYMNYHMLDRFFFDIDYCDMKVRIVFDRPDATQYIPTINIPEGVIRHMRCEVSSAAAAISVDIMYAKCHRFSFYHPPFGTVDFECNGLLLTKSGVALSPTIYSSLSPMARHEKLNDIIQDIRDRRAIYVDIPSPLRIAKMMAKGWTIVTKYVEQVEAVAGTEGAEMCIICHEDLADHYKLRCCNARYHRTCLVKALDSDNKYCVAATGQCIMCKQDTRAYEEVAILNAQKMI